MEGISKYIAENLRLSFAQWGAGSRMSSLVAALIALGFAVFTLIGGAASGVAPFSYVSSITLLLGAWFLFLTLIVTPYRMWVGQRHTIEVKDQAIAGLQLQLSGKSDTQEQLRRLWQLRDAGVEIRNERVASEAALPAWTARYQHWRDETLEAAGKLSPNLPHDLNVLNETGQFPAGINAINSTHALLLRVMSEILRRLEAHLRKFH